MRILLAFIFCAFSAHITVAQTAQPSTTPLSCACGGSSTTANLTSSELQARRGIPAFIVLRGQRFGGSFGEVVGGTQGMDIRGFPNAFGSQAFGGGITVQTAMNYGAIIGPFKAGVPTVATIVAEIVDVFGDVVTTASATSASLELGNLVPEWRKQYFKRLAFKGEITPVTTATNGRFEWSDVQVEGIAGTTLTLQVRHSRLPHCGCPIQFSLQGGFPYYATFATQAVNLDSSLIILPGHSGPFAVPGVVGNNVTLPSGFERPKSGYDGSLRHIVVGEPVRFPHSGKGTYPAIALSVQDRFGNFSSFTTTVTLTLNGSGYDQIQTPIIGNIVTSDIQWGRGIFGQESLSTTSAHVQQIVSNTAVFHSFTVLGVTSNQYSLYGSVRLGDPYITNETFGIPLGVFDIGYTSSTVSLMPGNAMFIKPVLIPDKYDNNRLKRMPSRFVIGQSNAADPAIWFYVQAVDEFGNRVDRGPNALNGATAWISFLPPEQGLPKAFSWRSMQRYTNGFQFTQSSDSNVKANKQKYSATGIEATAINGLFTFNNFTPQGPPSLDSQGNDVVLTFEASEEVRYPDFCTGRPSISCLASWSRYFGSGFIPPVTTATTTFLAPTSVRLSDAGRGRAISIAPNPATHSAEHVTVRYRLEEASKVRCEVVSMQGVVAARFDAGFQARGEQVFMLPLGIIASGVYAVRLTAGNQVQTVMMTVLR